MQICKWIYDARQLLDDVIDSECVDTSDTTAAVCFWIRICSPSLSSLQTDNDHELDSHHRENLHITAEYEASIVRTKEKGSRMP